MDNWNHFPIGMENSICQILHDAPECVLTSTPMGAEIVNSGQVLGFLNLQN
jgi:hypothetical protein